MAKYGGRILEAYCWKPPKKYPTGWGKRKGIAMGGCWVEVYSISKAGEKKSFGVGTVKLIPVSHKDIKEIAKLKRKGKR